VDARAWRVADPSVLVTPQGGGRATRGHAFVIVEEGGCRTAGLEPGVPSVLLAPLVPGQHTVRIEARGFVPVEAVVVVPALGYGDLRVEPKPVER
jgi:hypothetical protein